MSAELCWLSIRDVGKKRGEVYYLREDFDVSQEDSDVDPSFGLAAVHSHSTHIMEYLPNGEDGSPTWCEWIVPGSILPEFHAIPLQRQSLYNA